VRQVRQTEHGERARLNWGRENTPLLDRNRNDPFVPAYLWQSRRVCGGIPGRLVSGFCVGQRGFESCFVAVALSSAWRDYETVLGRSFVGYRGK
jgi:hypothetical protein